MAGLLCGLGAQGCAPNCEAEESRSMSWVYTPTAEVESIHAIRRGHLDIVDTGDIMSAIPYPKHKRSEVEPVHNYAAYHGLRTMTGKRLKISSYHCIPYQGLRTSLKIEAQLKIQPLVVGLSGLHGIGKYKGNFILDIDHEPQSPIWYQRLNSSPLDKSHYMLLVGHGCDKSGWEFYKFMNCWGPKWGANGFFYVSKEHYYPEGIFRMHMQVSYPILEESEPLRGVSVSQTTPTTDETVEKASSAVSLPGQIELFSHVPVLKNFVEHLRRKNFNVCDVYLLDSQFITDVTKFVSGCISSLFSMVQLELPHVNILSKKDLVTNKRDIENYLSPEPQTLLAELNQRMTPQFGKLNKSLIKVDQYSMVNFLPLDLRKDSRFVDDSTTPASVSDGQRC